MNICIISGSSRKGNNTIRLARAFEEAFVSAGQEVNVIDFKNYDLPFPNQPDIDADALSPFQEKLIGGMASAQVMLILTPEYNWFPSAEIVNMLHQLGTRKFSHLFDNKVFAVGGVSTGKGGRMPAVQLGYVLDKIISYFNKQSITSPRKFESHLTASMIDETGHIPDDSPFKKTVSDFAQYTLELAEKWFR